MNVENSECSDLVPRFTSPWLVPVLNHTLLMAFSFLARNQFFKFTHYCGVTCTRKVKCTHLLRRKFVSVMVQNFAEKIINIISKKLSNYLFFLFICVMAINRLVKQRESSFPVHVNLIKDYC